MKIAVIGTGTIGTSWAAYFLARGHDVMASDPGPDAEHLLHAFVENAWPTLTRLGLAPRADPARLGFMANSVQAVEGAEWVQESGPERIELKVELFAQISAALPPSTIIASSSSNLTPSAMQVRTVHPERLVLGHPFNPPHLIPLVEVAGGAQTSSEALDRAMQFYQEIGKFPIRLNKEIPGHVANRLQSALWREATYLVEQGVVSVEDVDAAISQGPGLRWALMGPIMTFHLAGGVGGLKYLMDHIGPDTLWPVLGQPAMTPSFQTALVDGVVAEAGGLTVSALAARRDDKLVALLKALSQFRTEV